MIHHEYSWCALAPLLLHPSAVPHFGHDLGVGNFVHESSLASGGVTLLKLPCAAGDGMAAVDGRRLH